MLLHYLGLVLLCSTFFWAGIVHFFKFREVAATMREHGLPAPGLLLAAGSVLEIAAGALLALSIAVPYAAAALALFTIAATVTMLDFWRYEGSERDTLRNGFAINVAVLGGLVVAGASAGS
jgi:putative oxidoreductase